MSAQHARLDLALIANGARTRPARALATPPLQISRARYDNPANSAELALTLTQLGGVLAGDCYDLNVEVSAAAQATITAAAATQIYTMPSGAAQQQVRICVAPDAELTWHTAPQILFSGATYRQHTQIELASGAYLALSEILVAGRLAHGECWRFDHYSSMLEICDPSGRLLAGERIVLEPGRRSPAVAGVMERFAVLGTLWLLGDTFDAERLARRISTTNTRISAAVLPAGCGLVVRVLGHQLTATQQTLYALANPSTNCPLP